MFLASVLVLLPVASFAQAVSESKPVIHRSEVSRANIAEYIKKAARVSRPTPQQKEAKQAADQALEPLSKEGKDLLDEIIYFRKYFFKMLNNTTYSEDQRRDFITQQFVIGVIDNYEKDKAVLKAQEKKVLLAFLSTPIGDVDWVQWMRDNYQKCGHEAIIKQKIGSFFR